MKRGSLVAPIDPKDRDAMSRDPFYKRCCLASEKCSGRIQWHHAVTYAGRRIKDRWAILPVCEWHHDHQSAFRAQQKQIILARTPLQIIKQSYPNIIL